MHRVRTRCTVSVSPLALRERGNIIYYVQVCGRESWRKQREYRVHCTRCTRYSNLPREDCEMTTKEKRRLVERLLREAFEGEDYGDPAAKRLLYMAQALAKMQRTGTCSRDFGLDCAEPITDDHVMWADEVLGTLDFAWPVPPGPYHSRPRTR